MRTKEELNQKILDITMKIQENYPELMTFLNEMPVTIPNEESPEIEVKSLEDYHESLVTLLNRYEETHAKNNK